MELNFERALVLAPHTDDGEFGCGGTIARLLRKSVDVFYVAFSVCEQSVPHGFSEDQLRIELEDATKTLGIKKSNVTAFRYQVRRFQERRQDILEDMIKLKREIKPDLVLMPCREDLHQDHQVIAAEGLRAFKDTSILSYEMPWNNLSITTSAFVKLEEADVHKKIAALRCYKTQSSRPYANEEFLKSLARTRGVQIGTHYAEAFELVRWII